MHAARLELAPAAARAGLLNAAELVGKRLEVLWRYWEKGAEGE